MSGQPSQAHDTEPQAEESVLSLIRQLQAGTLDAMSLPVPSRRLCVEHLGAEGYSVPEIAGILKVNDRTVARDRAAIREAHAVEPSPQLTMQMVGMLLQEAATCMSRIRRAARGTDVEPSVKIEAERTAWTVTREMIHTLQRLGYLPTAPQMIQGQLVHEIHESVTVEQIEQEVVRLSEMMQDQQQNGMVIDHKLIQDMDGVQKYVAQLAASAQLERLKAGLAVGKPIDNGDTDLQIENTVRPQSPLRRKRSSKVASTRSRSETK